MICEACGGWFIDPPARPLSQRGCDNIGMDFAKQCKGHAFQPGSRAYVEAECCPCCYDGEIRMSTGLVLGITCSVCDGTGTRPPPVDPSDPTRGPKP